MMDDEKDDLLEPINENLYGLIDREKSADSLAVLTPEEHKA